MCLTILPTNLHRLTGKIRKQDWAPYYGLTEQKTQYGWHFKGKIRSRAGGRMFAIHWTWAGIYLGSFSVEQSWTQCIMCLTHSFLPSKADTIPYLLPGVLVSIQSARYLAWRRQDKRELTCNLYTFHYFHHTVLTWVTWKIFLVLSSFSLIGLSAPILMANGTPSLS